MYKDADYCVLSSQFYDTNVNGIRPVRSGCLLKQVDHLSSADHTFVSVRKLIRKNQRNSLHQTVKFHLFQKGNKEGSLSFASKG